MNGSYLNNLTTTDLDRFGIKSFGHKSFILKHIQKLTSSPPKVHNEGNEQTAYIWWRYRSDAQNEITHIGEEEKYI